MRLASSIKVRFHNFKKLERSRKLSVVFLLIFLIFAQIVGIMSAGAVFEAFGNISRTAIPYGYVFIDFGIYEQESMEIQVPYYIGNNGLYNLEQVELGIRLKVRYVDNFTKYNVTQDIFYKKEILGDCDSLSELTGIFEGDFTFFNRSAVNIFLNESDPLEFFWVFGDIEISAMYFFRLISYRIILHNILLY